MMENFEHFLKALPAKPGVYQMFNAAGDWLYVGKAKHLQRRVASYFKLTGISPKTQALMQHVTSIQVIVTSTEREAFLLEEELIKGHHPRYNFRLRDDKTYPYLVLSDESFPRLFLHRLRKQQRIPGTYFGPYPEAGVARESLAQIQKTLGVRTCTTSVFSSRKRPCLHHFLGRCPAPCVGLISEAAYRRLVKKIAAKL